ncbi:cysteine desulfurase NifS [Lachnospiraceae bacterium oral taxon 096]|nr:cysteine desulfurase NifS [Lachnospiraceae bacterium oral taxon 096]QUI95993.1 cysteine desulfurase [Lachnospiraceae bacterium oral taxon 096]
MRVYFDNSASTKVADSVIEVMIKTMREDYGNPSAKHMMGVAAEKYVKEATRMIAKTLKVEEKEILFTSGGTESNNIALIGGALANQRRGKHIISTAIEHPAVYEPLGKLVELGFEVTILPVDRAGHICLEELKNAIREDTIIVSTMYVNNEVGAVEPVEEIAKIVHEKNPDCLYHVDAIQGYGKYKIQPKKQGIDLMSVSGHKLHGPKGVGFLYIQKDAKVNPILFGGGQQRGMRSGTINVPGIAGMGEAARLAYEHFDEKIEKMIAIKDYLMDQLEKMEGIHLNSFRGTQSAPHILSVSVQGVRAEVLLHALEDREIYVSSGSACSSNHPGISGTLKGIGLEDEFLDSTVRISLCSENTLEEADYFLETLKELLPMLRRFTRK